MRSTLSGHCGQYLEGLRTSWETPATSSAATSLAGQAASSRRLHRIATRGRQNESVHRQGGRRRLVETSRRALVVPLSNRRGSDAVGSLGTLHPAFDNSSRLFHLGELPNNPTGLNATSTVSFGYLCVALTAMPETMYCNGIPSGFGLSGCPRPQSSQLQAASAGFYP